MESIKYEITEQDIKKYLSVHSKDEIIKFKEALFVKYIKHQDRFTKEKMEMLLNKDKDKDLGHLYCIDEILKRDVYNQDIYDFYRYISTQVLDTSAYMHILIPVLKLYKGKMEDITLTNGHIENFIPRNLNGYNCGMLVDTIENYQIAGKIKKTDDLITIDDVYLTQNECKKELVEYSKIYGKDSVEKIKKLVKEG